MAVASQGDLPAAGIDAQSNVSQHLPDSPRRERSIAPDWRYSRARVTLGLKALGMGANRAEKHRVSEARGSD
jgi:hypothetical protein